MRKTLHTLRSRVGRVMRDVERQLAGDNLRMILRKLRLPYAFVVAVLSNLGIAADVMA